MIQSLLTFIFTLLSIWVSVGFAAGLYVIAKGNLYETYGKGFYEKTKNEAFKTMDLRPLVLFGNTLLGVVAGYFVLRNIIKEKVVKR